MNTLQVADLQEYIDRFSELLTVAKDKLTLEQYLTLLLLLKQLILSEAMDC